MSAQKKAAKSKPAAKKLAPKKAVAKKAASKTTVAKPVAAKSPAKRASGKSGADRWNLRLYVAGQTPKSLTAFANLKQLCETHLAGRYNIEVIDLLEKPQLASGDQIVAIPTLVRKLPAPIKRIIGNLSNLDRVMVGMDLKPTHEP